MTTNTKTVAFVNLKGGVGKTTSAIGTARRCNGRGYLRMNATHPA